MLRAQAELARLSEVDDLTGLANRRGFFAELRRAMPEADATGRSVVVLYCDVDGLKRVNDTYGHEAGDLLLVEVARRLQLEFTDARCVARPGGDEFGVVLVTAPGPAAVTAAAGRASQVEDVTAEAVWSLSVGAAASDELPVPEPRQELSQDRDLVGAVVGLADERMYEAKRLRPPTRP